MKWEESFRNSFENRYPFLIFEFTFNLEDIIELSIGTVLKDKIEVELISEETIEFDEVYMIEVRLYCYLSRELVSKILFPDGLFFDDFKGNEETTSEMSISLDMYLAR